MYMQQRQTHSDVGYLYVQYRLFLRDLDRRQNYETMRPVLVGVCRYTDKKENQVFLIYKEIQSGAVAKSYMTNGLLIYGEIFAHFFIY